MICGIDIGFILAYIGILFPNVFAPVPQRVLLEVPSSFWHPFGSVLAPFGTALVSFWLPSASFFLPFAARHGIVMHFRIMSLDFCFGALMLIVRRRDRGFAVQSIFINE